LLFKVDEAPWIVEDGKGGDRFEEAEVDDKVEGAAEEYL